jgi:polar amino acid transport system substrate-binding protein
MPVTSQILRMAAAGVLLSGLSLPALSQDHPEHAPLTAALDVGFAPYAFTDSDGAINGFSQELLVALASQLGRPSAEPQDVTFSAIFAGLFSKRYEMIAAPVNATKQRAESMLFSEPYLATESAMLVRTGTSAKSLDDLRGKAIAVNNGSGGDKEVTEWSGEYKFAVQRYNTNPDAIQALMTGRADAVYVDANVARYATTQTPGAEVAFTIPVGLNVSYFFRKDDAEFRNTVDVALECLKKNGTMAEIYKKWFGVEPAAGSPAATIYPGYGVPGFDGYDPTEHELACQ